MHDQLRAKPISTLKFEIFVCDDEEDDSFQGAEDSARAGKWSWRAPSFTQVKKIARHFDFVEACPDHMKDRALEVQNVMREWINNWSELCEAWPGDGKDFTADETHEKHCELMQRATEGRGDAELEPGEDDFEDSLFPVHTTTPHCHTYMNHLGKS